jgi:hypothetical protein
LWDVEIFDGVLEDGEDGFEGIFIDTGAIGTTEMGHEDQAFGS